MLSKVLDQLYEGDLEPIENVQHSEEYEEALQVADSLETKLEDSLNEEQKGLLDKLMEAQSGVNIAEGKERFKQGYSYALLLIIEAISLSQTQTKKNTLLRDIENKCDFIGKLKESPKLKKLEKKIDKKENEIRACMNQEQCAQLSELSDLQNDYETDYGRERFIQGFQTAVDLMLGDTKEEVNNV